MPGATWNAVVRYVRTNHRELGFFVLTCLAVLPLWIVKRPPSQDWPQHVAAVRVLIDQAEPQYRMTDAVIVDLTRTQYIGFYMLSAALAKLLGAASAVKLVISATLIAIPYGLRSLLRATGSDERYAAFAVALTYSTHLIMGFLSFLAAIPLSLFAIHAAIRYRERPSLWRALALASWLVALFFMHLLPFAFALCGIALVLTGCSLRSLVGGVLALAPALGLSAWWAIESPAGDSTAGMLTATLHRQSTLFTRFDSPEKIVKELPDWLTDVLPGSLDVGLLAASIATLLIGALALRERGQARWKSKPRSVLLVALLPLFALGCTFALPVQHTWIWPISSRFVYLFVLLLPLLLPRMRARAGDLVAALLALSALAHITLIGVTFRRVAREDRGFDGALAQIPDGARVLGLMYAAASEHVLHHVFMHQHAYAQAEHGGVLMYSFAMLPQSPFYYRPFPDGPPPIDLGVGWTAQRANMSVAAMYFEYCLAHGEHPHLNAVRNFYDQIYESNGWSVYRRAHLVQ